MFGSWWGGGGGGGGGRLDGRGCVGGVGWDRQSQFYKRIPFKHSYNLKNVPKKVKGAFLQKKSL